MLSIKNKKCINPLVKVKCLIKNVTTLFYQTLKHFFILNIYISGVALESTNSIHIFITHTLVRSFNPQIYIDLKAIERENILCYI